MKGLNEEHLQVWTPEYDSGKVFCTSLGYMLKTLTYDGVKGLIINGAELTGS